MDYYRNFGYEVWEYLKKKRQLKPNSSLENLLLEIRSLFETALRGFPHNYCYVSSKLIQFILYAARKDGFQHSTMYEVDWCYFNGESDKGHFFLRNNDTLIDLTSDQFGKQYKYGIIKNKAPYIKSGNEPKANGDIHKAMEEIRQCIKV